MKIHLSILIYIAMLVSAEAQNRYLVYFEGKGDVSNLNIEEVLSPRAIKNHKKNNIIINELDFPVNPIYLTNISGIGNVVKTSKWLNAVIINSTKTAEFILALPYVKEVETLETGIVIKDNKFKIEEQTELNKTLNYDSTYKQNTQIGVDCLHDKGFLGENVLLAVIDAGFKGMDTILAFDSLYLQNRVVDKYDFIDNDTTVYEKHFHGTMVSSVIAGNQINYIGSAPNVSLCLYITEDVTREVHEEEFDLVRGLERADSIGADLVNISLGYFQFDSLQGDYTYADMDGETTIAALGTQIATSKGLLIVTSAGNSGPDYIGTPCDADSILCVGATDTNSIVAGFSSVGPSADGRVKPDVAAIGKRAYCVDTDGTIKTCNGTSFSSPLTCGMVACLIQAHPTLTMMDFINSVRQSGSQFSSPDSLLGYGIPKACVADSLLALLEVGINESDLKENVRLNIYPNPTTGYVTISSSDKIELVQLISMEGRMIKQYILSNKNSVLLNFNDIPKGCYIIKVNHSQYNRLVKY
jgi:subtilisin family serine protease